MTISIRDRFNETIINSNKNGEEGWMRWRYDLACEECKRQADTHEHPQIYVGDYMEECERCAVLEFLEDAVFGLYLTIKEARQQGRFKDKSKARAHSPMEALSRGLEEWYNPDVMGCGHKGYVRLEDARCSSCLAAEIVKERKAQASKPPQQAKPVQPKLTPEQIAEACQRSSESVSI
jgi:hypothetical protein